MNKNISWTILTWNRSEFVEKAIPYCAKNSGFPISEIVHVDNGSSPDELKRTKDVIASLDIKTTSIYFPENRGVAKGLNAAWAMASMDYIVLTGMDMLMSDNWLYDMMKVLDEAPNCGMSLVYSRDINKHPERIRGPEFEWNGYRLQSAMPIERRLISKSLQREIGFFPEWLGLYAYDDCCWAEVAEKVMRSKGLQSYCLIDKIAQHLGNEGIESFNGKENPEYHAMKQREVQDPAKQIKIANWRSNGSPKFNPYA